jgi:hypothetical protein
LVRLNRRCGVGAVAPGDTESDRVRGSEGPGLDRLSNFVMYSGGAGLGEEGVDERSGWEQWLWLDVGHRWTGPRQEWADLGADPPIAAPLSILVFPFGMSGFHILNSQ